LRKSASFLARRASRLTTGLSHKAPSGFEPLYGALQAPA
jgi:hypothetical protein